ncbi:hypothetical protein PENTCL1PPCAC_1986, partial [Pristionchus entomophagus]
TNEQLCDYFTRFILFVYSLLFRIISRIKKRTFTPLTKDFLDTLAILPEEWTLERKQEKDDHIVFDATTCDGETTVFISIHTTGECLETFVHLQSGGRTLICPSTLSRMSAGTGSTFLAGPLRLEMREPFRKWRIQYRGLMIDESTGDQVFVNLAGWWKPTSDAKWRYNFVDTDTFRDQLMSRPFCLLKNARNAKNLLDTTDLAQWGELHCELSISGEEKKEPRLRGLRTRYRDLVQHEQQFSVYFDHGDRLLYSRRQCEQGSITHGFIARGDQMVVPLTLLNKDSLYGLNYGDKDIINFEQVSFPYAISKISPPTTFSFKTATGEAVSVTRLTVRHRTYDGQAILIQRNAPFTKAPAPTLPPIPEYTAYGAEREMPVLPFSHRACQDSSITGGKAANLARLTSIAKGFIVPRGISVTTSAFETHLNAHSNIKKLVEKLGHQGNDLETCLHLGEQIGAGLTASIMSEELKAEITETLLNETGSETRFAVRSSAVGEDGSELSSAGQLESYMEVQINDVPDKVLLCWASNYRRECLSYRRQYGQPINPLMGVVVQRMIENGVAGVMFTCDPVRGDPSRVVINAFKGKGEDVVSGTVTPDTVVLRKLEGTVMEQSEPCCLVEIAQSRLLQTGLYLEGLFGEPQDVEFVVNLTTNEINVVQSRDVTGRERESDFELKTEFNSPNLTDHECYTMANVGEVMPEPVTPLFISSTMKAYDSSLMSKSEVAVRCNRHTTLSFTAFNHRIIFNHGELFLRLWEQNEKDRIAEFALGGQELFTKEMFEMGKNRFPRQHKFFPLYRLANTVKIMVHDSYELTKNANENERECRSYVTGDTPAERLANLEKQREVFTKMIIAHMGESIFSSFTYVIIAMIVRGKDHGDFTPQNLSDIAAIFSSGTETGAISADVPTALKNLAIAVALDGVSADQLEDEKNGLELIKTGKNSSAHFERFMGMHGHRGPGELDFVAQTWIDHPELLVHTVKGMVATPEALKTSEAHAEIDAVLDSLRSLKITGMKRWFMKLLVRQSHRAVALREECKNYLVQGAGHMRANVAALGEQLVEQGFLPEKDLVFFFTLPELHHFIHSRAPRFISRAMRRRKIFPTFRGKRYEYFWQGPAHEIPEPTVDLLKSTSLSGTTVCEGLVVARARVAKSIDDARDTQPGEILITTYTDICWSPLFPIVKGLVTEVGGLLSHGAVVAREYGLPSLIAVKLATDVFKTGDMVELNATKGTISKVIEKTEEEN